MDKIDAFFSSYNNKLKGAYDRALKESEKSIDKGFTYDKENLQIYLDQAAVEWEGEALEELNGMNPVQYLGTVTTLGELTKMFDRAPIVCDEGLPDIYIKRLKGFGDLAINELLKIAATPEVMDTEEETFLVPLMAVKLLGDWRIERAVPNLLSLLDRQGINFDIFAEQIKAALVSIGYPAIDMILEAIEQKDVNDTSVEYLLMALAEAARTHKSERIYKCLKNAFHSMKDKVLGALCLKGYEDGRAVPALRGFLEKNKGKLEKENYYEIVSAIKALGGDVEGL